LAPGTQTALASAVAFISRIFENSPGVNAYGTGEIVVRDIGVLVDYVRQAAWTDVANMLNNRIRATLHAGIVSPNLLDTANDAALVSIATADPSALSSVLPKGQLQFAGQNNRFVFSSTQSEPDDLLKSVQGPMKSIAAIATARAEMSQVLGELLRALAPLAEGVRIGVQPDYGGAKAERSYIEDPPAIPETETGFSPQVMWDNQSMKDWMVETGTDGGVRAAATVGSFVYNSPAKAIAARRVVGSGAVGFGYNPLVIRLYVPIANSEASGVYVKAFTSAAMSFGLTVTASIGGTPAALAVAVNDTPAVRAGGVIIAVPGTNIEMFVKMVNEDAQSRRFLLKFSHLPKGTLSSSLERLRPPLLELDSTWPMLSV